MLVSKTSAKSYTVNILEMIQYNNVRDINILLLRGGLFFKALNDLNFESAFSRIINITARPRLVIYYFATNSGATKRVSTSEINCNFYGR